jgi:hypothetical protein
MKQKRHEEEAGKVQEDVSVLTVGFVPHHHHGDNKQETLNGVIHKGENIDILMIKGDESESKQPLTQQPQGEDLLCHVVSC